jgi:hypothetical protein
MKQVAMEPLPVIESEDTCDGAIRAVLNNETLNDEEKCFLYLAIAKRQLYKQSVGVERHQFTFEVRQDPTYPELTTCVVRRVKKKTEKKKAGRLRRIVISLAAPSIGAVISVYFRQWCMHS